VDGIFGNNPNESLRAGFAPHVGRADLMMSVVLLGHVTGSVYNTNLAFKGVIAISDMDIVNRIPVDVEGASEDDMV
jgi:hypothetical protein